MVYSRSKRKREEDLDEVDYDDNDGFIDDESEPHRFGTSVLPVANLPYSFEGVPQDGMEYLFTVRREERRLPLVTRVPNPYAISEKTHGGSGMNGNGASNLSMNVIPSEQWRTCFEERFRNLRANLRQPTIHISLPSTSEACGIPEMRDRDRWWAFFRGDVEWQNVPSSQFHAAKRGKRDKQKQETAGCEEALLQEEKMHGWVVYEEKLSWEQMDKEEVAEISYGSDPNTGPVEFGDGGEDGNFSDKECSPRESSAKEKVAEVASPLRRNSPSPPTNVCDDPAVSGDGIRPREPTPHLLSLLDQKTTFHLLKYFSQWIQGHFDRSLLSPPPPLPPSHPDYHSHETPSYGLTSCHGRWIFSLLSHLDSQLTSDEISVLRNLARDCVKLIGEERSCHRTSLQQPTVVPRVGEKACWIIVAAVAGIWGQKDLWVDAADMLQ